MITELWRQVLMNSWVVTLLAAFAWLLTRWIREPRLVHGIWLLLGLKLLMPTYASVELRPATWFARSNVPAGIRERDLSRERNPTPEPAGVRASQEIAQSAASPASVVGSEVAVSPALDGATDAAMLSSTHSEATTPLAPSTATYIDNTSSPLGDASQPLLAPAGGSASDVGHAAFITESTIAGAWAFAKQLWTSSVYVWCVGGVLWLTVAGLRIWRFHRRIRALEPASRELVERAASVADRIGLKSIPSIRMSDGSCAPLLWPIGQRPTIVLPASLMRSLNTTETEAILAHELAHVLRRDHWVRHGELLCGALYWWFPVWWWIRRSIRQAEEECCDAICVRYFSHEGARSYAEALWKVAEWTADQRQRVPILASSMGARGTLARRIEMILESQASLSAQLSRAGRWALCLVALVVLPWSFSWAGVAEESDGPPAVTDVEPPTQSAELGESPVGESNLAVVQAGPDPNQVPAVSPAQESPTVVPTQPPAWIAAKREQIEYLERHLSKVRKSQSLGQIAESELHLGAYELANTQAELAQGLGRQAEAMAQLREAHRFAEDHLRAIEGAFDAGQIRGDAVMQAARMVFAAKAKLAEPASDVTGQGPAAASTAADAARPMLYEGKTFAEWAAGLNELDSAARTKTVAAICEFGRNGMMEEAIAALRSVFVVNPRPLNAGGHRGQDPEITLFVRLGEPTIPVLIEVVERRNAYSIPAILGLQQFGERAKPALPALLALAPELTESTKGFVALLCAAKSFAVANEEVLRLAHEGLLNDDLQVRAQAAATLVAFHSQVPSDSVITVMRAWLEHALAPTPSAEESFLWDMRLIELTTRDVLSALGQLGPEARDVIPLLDGSDPVFERSDGRNIGHALYVHELIASTLEKIQGKK